MTKKTKEAKKYVAMMQKLLTSGIGDDISSICVQFNNKENPFHVLETFLSKISFFQDDYNKILDELKSFYKDNEEVLLYLGPLHNHIKECGRDQYKKEKNQIVIQNHTFCYKKKFSFKRHQDKITCKRIFVLVNEYYTTPLRLDFIKNQYQQPTSIFNKAAIEEATLIINNFLAEHTAKIIKNISALQKMFL